MSENEARLLIGESFAGEGGEAAHVNVALGPSGGPVGAAFVGALANPKPGHVPYVVVAQPSVPVKPYTLFVNKADLRGDPTHERATWGAAQAGVARGVCDAASVLPEEAADGWVIVAAVWVDWKAADLDAVYRNNRLATREAIERALSGEPRPAVVMEAARAARNPFYEAPAD